MGSLRLRVSYALLLGIFLASAVFGAKEDDNDDSMPEASRRPLCKTVFVQMSEVYQEALLNIAEDRIDEARTKVAANDFTEEQKLFLWRLISGRDGKAALRALSDFKFSQTALEEIAVDFASKDPTVALGLVPELRAGSNELFTVLKTLAAKIDILPVYERFGELSEEQRAELSILQLRNGFADSWINNQHHYALTNPAPVAEVTAVLTQETKYYPEQVTGYAQNLPNFTVPQKMKIAIAMAKSAGLTREWGHFQTLVALGAADFPLEARTEIAGIGFAEFVNKHGWSHPHFEVLFQNQGEAVFGLDRTNVTDILIHTLKRVDKKMLRTRPERDALLFAAYKGKFMALGTAVGKLKKVIFARDGMATIAEHHNLETLEELHLIDEAAALDLTRALLKFAEENPDLLPKDFVNILWDPVRNQSVVLKMLKEYLAQNEAKWDHLPENSMQLITEVTGLSYADLVDSRVRRNPGEFYELVMDIQDGLAKPAFKNVKIEPAVFEKRQEFLRLLRALRDLHEQNGDGTKGWRATFKTLGLSTETGITVANLPTLYTRAQEALVASIREKLAGQNIAFTYEQFRALEEKWGDLEPIWTLLSRYQSEAKWQQEIAPLALVFEASLQGTFHQKKFEGGFNMANDVAKAQAQLHAFTTPAQRQAWMKPRWKVAVPDAREAVAQAAQEAEALETVREALKDTVEEPLKTALGEVAPSISTKVAQSFHREKLQPLLSEKLLNEDPIPLVDGLIGDLRETTENLEAPQAAREILRMGLEVVLDPATSPQELRAGLRLVRTLLTSHKEMDLGELPETVKQGLGQADRAIKELGSKASGEFVLAVMNADPKFLLTIGNVVQTNSCQSYSAGGHIETLLGYVMDANVQAVVSFALKQQQFKSASDFNQIVKAQAEGRLRDVLFDGNLRQATFVLDRAGAAAGDEPLKIESEPLGNAYQRQMVKLGYCQRCGHPGLRLERLYQQQHAQANQMQTMHQEILSDVILEMGLTNNEHQITIPPSRNPGGVYSDAGGGIKVNTEYVIP